LTSVLARGRVKPAEGRMLGIVKMRPPAECFRDVRKGHDGIVCASDNQDRLCVARRGRGGRVREDRAE